MGRLGSNAAPPRPKHSARADNCECGSFLAGENEDEEDVAPAVGHKCRVESNKKIYVFSFVSTTVVVCFCIFVVVPQLIEYFTDPNVRSIESSVYATQKQSVIELVDTERSRRNQERLDIMRKFDMLQRNYKRLQVEYQKAQENYRKKLHNAYKTEGEEEEEVESSERNPDVKSTTSLLEENDVEMINLNNEIFADLEGKNENSRDNGIPYHVVVS